MARRAAARRPELSVVLSTLGMYDVLRRVLDGYSEQSASCTTFELVVVIDKADPDPGAVEAAIGERPYAVRVITGPEPGLSANRNAGWREARAPLVLFTDNDTIPNPSLVAEHLGWHGRHPQVEVGVLGRVRWAPELEVTPFMRWLDRGIQFDYEAIHGTDAGWARFYGANASVKRRFVERVGDFDQERLPYGYEDLDWAYRAREHGFRLLYNAGAVVDHLRPMTLEFWKRRVRRAAVAERRFVGKHPELEPYYFKLFSRALEEPPASGRGLRLARWVPPWLPVMGPRVWTSADLSFRQALAPHFLEAWQEADTSEGPDVSERTDLRDAER
jgi:GT2 family glycosyltransferase